MEFPICTEDWFPPQVSGYIDAKCRNQQEKDKYKSYIDDIDKIIRLLLKLSGLLARAENTIQGLAENTDEKIKVNNILLWILMHAKWFDFLPCFDFYTPMRFDTDV